eukprot:3225959-Rhodomonas_salina.1
MMGGERNDVSKSASQAHEPSRVRPTKVPRRSIRQSRPTFTLTPHINTSIMDSMINHRKPAGNVKTGPLSHAEVELGSSVVYGLLAGKVGRYLVEDLVDIDWVLGVDPHILVLRPAHATPQNFTSFPGSSIVFDPTPPPKTRPSLTGFPPTLNLHSPRAPKSSP